MKVIILAGGYGTRISEESHLRPKPMIEIGGYPILWHIMKIYSHYGFNDFIICGGYKSYMIKEYFADYYLRRSDVTFDFTENNKTIIHHNVAEPWKVTIVHTGSNTQTGGRLKRVSSYINNQRFLLTYGDGLSDINLNALIQHHEKSQKAVTLTAVQPGGRFGVLDIQGDTVTAFKEKAVEDGGWVNGGFMVAEAELLNAIEGDSTVLERAPLEKLSASGGLGVYKHHGFWQCMDTQRDKHSLENMWETDTAKWKVW